MKLDGYYSSGDFAKMAKVSVRTIRFYDSQNILKPSYVHPNGSRFYTDEDLARLQQILLFKFLGFSLEDIRQMGVYESNHEVMLHALSLQQKLVQEKMEQLQLISESLSRTVEAIQSDCKLNSRRMLELIHLTGMEKSLKNQYENASNINARIALHTAYSANPLGWFPWIFSQLPLHQNCRVLELGCGNGALWQRRLDRLPEGSSLELTDISEGMLRDAKRNLSSDANSAVHFRCVDCRQLPYEADSFDMVLANHLLFYCEQLPQTLSEVSRVLRPGGCFICSSYGRQHMAEISQLVQRFDQHLVLSAEQLYERFGLENGADILRPYFDSVELLRYEDYIMIGDAEPLIEYILSCHGNQRPSLLSRYSEFRSYVEKQLSAAPMRITKDAGIFRCRLTAPAAKAQDFTR